MCPPVEPKMMSVTPEPRELRTWEGVCVERKTEVRWPEAGGMDAGKAKSTDTYLNHLPSQIHSVSHVLSFPKGHRLG